MPGNPRIRASDADRDRAAALLREHHAAGRLTAAEFHDRLEQAMEAATLGDIDDLMSDLPAIDLYELPDASLRRQNRNRQNRSRHDPGPNRSLSQSLAAGDPVGGELQDMQAVKMAIAAWATVAGALVTIGLVTGIAIGGLSPWWVFAFIPAGAVFWLWFLFRRSQH